MIEYVGLFFELLFLIFGLYLYLFATGKVQARKEQNQKQVDAFRERNGWWMRIGGLAIMAIMVVNIYLHLAQLWGS